MEANEKNQPEKTPNTTGLTNDAPQAGMSEGGKTPEGDVLASSSKLRPYPAGAPKWHRLALAIISLFAIIGLVGLCMSFAHGIGRHNGFHNVRYSGGGNFSRQTPELGYGHGMRGGMMMGGNGMRDNMIGRQTGSTHLNGVVIAVNGSTITVAGNGTTKKVIVNDDTVYKGAAKPAAVNDTIKVVGTDSDDTLTAIRVFLGRQ